MVKKLVLTIVCLASVFMSSAQKWIEYMHDPHVNFYVTQKEARKYFDEKELGKADSYNKEGNNNQTEEEDGYQLFKSWERYMEPRVYPSGDVTLPHRMYKEFLRQKADYGTNKSSHPVANRVQSNTWTPIGPMGDMVYGDAGRLNFVRFDPVNNNSIWVGAPVGGLWHSTNNGVSWTTNTDQLASKGYCDLAINPLNTQIMYLATGDGDAYFSGSIGVLKSVDGGVSWDTTGTIGTGQYLKLFRLLIDPSNPQVLIVSANDGIYRSSNAGASWVQVSTMSANDLEFKPGNSGTVYASGIEFQISTNNGLSWTTVTNGVPTSVNRLAIAVSPADPNYVYMLASDNNSSGFSGLYLSTNSGASFNTQSTSPNLLGWYTDGSDVGGQGTYTLSLAVSPVNKNEILVGGVNIWRSLDGGLSWTLNGEWLNETISTYVHADVHDLVYLNGNTVWAATDGGVFYTPNNGTSWTASNNLINVSEVYHFGLSSTNPAKIIASYQDCGTNLLNGASWTNIGGGDGWQGFIDWNNDNNMYWCDNGGAYSSINGNIQWMNLPESYGFLQDPVSSTTLWSFGINEIYKSTDQGMNWNQTAGTLPSDQSVTNLKVAKSNSQVVYVITFYNVFKTTDGGNSWTDITGTLSALNLFVTGIEVDPTDANTALITLSGYSAGDKVYKTTDGGLTWSNFSDGLPNLPIINIIYESAQNKALYVALDNGVYYRDTTMNTWVPYGIGLPNTEIRDFAIFHPTEKLRVATLGRGIWEVDLFNPVASTPFFDFVSDNVKVFPNPSKGNFSVKTVLEKKDNLIISVCDIVGKEISSTEEHNTFGGVRNIDLSQHGAGIYFVKVSTSRGTVIKKIVLEN
jgi:photosystem II stability/assembly factor-like uncharacterized protein